MAKCSCIYGALILIGYIMEAQKNSSGSSTLFILAQTDVKGLIPKVRMLVCLEALVA